MLGYADESGEPGRRKNDNDYFCFCIVLFNDRKQALRCSERIDEFRIKHHLEENHEFHFATDSKKTKSAFVSFLGEFDFTYVFVSIKKTADYRTASFNEMSKQALTLLERNGIDANIVMDINPRLYKEFRTRKKEYSVKLHFSEKKSRGNNLIQLADYVVAITTRHIKHPKSSATKKMCSFISDKLIDDIVM